MGLSARGCNRFVAWTLGAMLAVGAGAATAAEAVAPSKDAGPASARCDRHEKGGAAWSACVGEAQAAMPAAELFYAGYWLAKSGQYEQALGYLRRADQTDARVLTYIGFATRKLGHVDAALPLYARALEIDPGYSVARAYLGEAYLSLGEPAKALGELKEIARRCGTTCAAYADLAGHIARFEAAALVKG